MRGLAFGAPLALLAAAVAGASLWRGRQEMSDTKHAAPRPADRTPPRADAADQPDEAADPAPAEGTQLATFGSGCFWCTEAVFSQLKGVESAVSGYSGGRVKRPTYQDVCSGTTGHAEVIQVTYDPRVISYPELLEVFWKTHDPTTLNRQGNDVGTQYRSV